MNYTQKQEELLKQFGIGETVATLVDRWSALIEECETGYQWDVSELSNELQARDKLDRILSAPELQEFGEHRELSARANELDRQFQALLQPDIAVPGTKGWWHRGVLRFAGEEYARYMARAHGFSVELARS